MLARHQTDRRLSGTAWLEYFDTVSDDATAGNVIRSMIEGGSARPVEDFGVILRSGGIPFSTTGNAIVVGPDAI